MILDATLTTSFEPGTNLKGGAAGASWVYLLPSFELEQVVSIGEPSAASLSTLARVARRVVVVSRPESGPLAAADLLAAGGVGNVKRFVPEDAKPPVQPGSTDLLFVARPLEVARHGGWKEWSTWQRWLKPCGQIYFETAGVTNWLCQPWGRVLGRDAAAQSFWLTPLCGESHTFTPADDSATIAYFRRHKLTSRSLRPAAIKQSWRRRQPAAKRRPGSSVRRGHRSGVLRPAKAVARATLGLSYRAEQLLGEAAGFRRSLGRRGVLIGPRANQLGEHPPRYLCSIANDSGLSIEDHRWGLSASGDYDSRKMLFYLFERQQTAPAYVVKMTRSSKFNLRLDRERDALQRLAARKIGDQATLPRVVFSGTHGGLAILGETAIQGVPFDRRTSGTASCQHARSAIEWLTQLGADTAAPFAGETGELAAGLARLLSRFAELYPIAASVRSFLESQISVLQFNRCPLVFQHGDPGRWNVLITPDDRCSFLDWEAAEPHGVPLWDLLYFLRSFCVCVSQAQRTADSPLRGLETSLLSDTPTGHLVVAAVQRYCTEVGLAQNLVEPLFYTCWMHRALKEATRLPSEQLADGHFFRFLRLCIERRESPILQRLFGE